MMKYSLDLKKFKQYLAQQGYRGMADFARKAKIHRNTLQNLIRGKELFCRAFSKIAAKLKVDPLDLMSPQFSISTKVKNVQLIYPFVVRLLKEDKNITLVLLGSRVTGQMKKYSDWDIGVLRYPQPLTGKEFLKLKGILDEMSEDFVYQIDLINLNQAPHWFLESIQHNVIYLEGNLEGFSYLQGIFNGIEKEKAA
ncbi:MAG: nucleotidyltransferase domain-containing protein [Deltaproteobacteria bacterium]|nr:nucleotidyltransferase domain-containing protein [Deltaproteobacteria bacterium]